MSFETADFLAGLFEHAGSGGLGVDSIFVAAGDVSGSRGRVSGPSN